MKKAVLFDLDGTLADTIESIAKAGNRALEACGFPGQPLEAYKYFAGDGADTLVRRVLRAAGDQECSAYEKVFAKYQEFFKNGCTYHVKPFDGIPELLAALKEKGIKTGVVSNKPHLRTIDVVEGLFGKGSLDIVVGQKEGVPKKPDPSVVLAAADSLGVSPEECMYVGDTNVDMITGNAAGMYTVGVLWGFRDKEELEANHAHAIVKEPGQLLELLLAQDVLRK